MFKLDEDPLQSQVYFLAFVESLEMIFSQYKETCELLPDYPKIGGENIKEFAKKDIRNLLHANIDVHSKKIINELPGDRIKCIEKLQSHWANMTFADKSRYDRTFQQVTHKGGGIRNELHQYILTFMGFISFSREKLLKGSTDAHICG